MQCTIRIENESSVIVSNVEQYHMNALHEYFSVFAKNYMFTPKYKLGAWDGKIRYFSKAGRTYFNLLPQVISKLKNYGYDIKIQDDRVAATLPELIDDNIFCEHDHPDTGDPIRLYDYQVNAVNQLIQHGYGICVAATGAGKAQPLDAKILTPSGWTVMGNLRIGDQVISQSGNPTTVLGIYPQGKKDIYTITFHDGSSTEVCLDHLWNVNIPIKPHSAKTEKRTVTTSDILAFMNRKKSGQYTPGNISIPMCDPIIFECSSSLPLDSYLLGVLLGDGSCQSTGITISNESSTVIDHVSELIDKFDLSLKRVNRVDYHVTAKQRSPHKPNPLKNRLS